MEKQPNRFRPIRTTAVHTTISSTGYSDPMEK
jgi:hypothetical protein